VTWPSEAPAGPRSAEEESYRILRSRIDLSRLPVHSRDVTERVIYATADFEYATDLVCDEEALATAVTALAAGAPVVADAAMVAAGITGCPVICKIGEPLTTRLARTASICPAAAAVRLAFGEVGPGAVWVVGGSLSNVSEKGGAAVAVAALEALLRSAMRVSGSRAGWGPGTTT
jgi:precorrin-8X/cobalt-precorrin-8 methylmutase